jgi:putative transposase
VRYAFISQMDAEKAYPISFMCRMLEVSRSGYYDWCDRPASATFERRERLKAMITAIFEHNDGTYGYRRIHAVLVRSGEQVGPELVRQLMAELGLVACQPRPYRVTTIPDPGPATPDLVGRDFTAERPGQKLVGDITYLRTWAGWLYLATVIDCHTRAVVGWSMAEHMRASLVIDALNMAAGNISLPEDPIFHSDRGTQYTSAEFRAALARQGITQSVGRTGQCWDNALAESFFAALKNELVYRTAFPTREHARKAVARYIEVFYNRRRLHSGLDYRTPQEVYDEYLNRQLAA